MAMFDQMKQMKELAGLLGNAKQLQERAEKVQQELAHAHVTGEALAGACRVTLTGQMQVVRVEVDPALVKALSAGGDKADKAALEQAVAAATQEAISKAQQLMKDKLQGVLGGVQLPPGMQIPGMGM